MLYSLLKKINFDAKIILIDPNNNTHEFGKGDRFIKVRLKTKSIEKKLFIECMKIFQVILKFFNS